MVYNGDRGDKHEAGIDRGAFAHPKLIALGILRNQAGLMIEVIICSASGVRRQL